VVEPHAVFGAWWRERKFHGHRRGSASVPLGPVLGWSNWYVVLVAGVKPAQLGVGPVRQGAPLLD
jgi:hypothetical protein